MSAFTDLPYNNYILYICYIPYVLKKTKKYITIYMPWTRVEPRTYAIIEGGSNHYANNPKLSGISAKNNKEVTN
jgi:hypothetical protein